MIFLDIETDRKASVIWCVVVIEDGYFHVWKSPKGLQEFIEGKDVYAHNGIGFDYPVLKRLWGVGIKRKHAKDTLVLSRLYHPDIEGGHSLKAWGSRLGHHKLDFEDYDGGLTDEMITYCIRDTEVLSDLYTFLTSNMKAFSQQSIDLEHSVAIIMAQQERNGFMLDVVKATGLCNTFTNRMAEIEEELQEIFPPIVTERWSEKTGKQLKDDVEVFNVGSRLQIAKRLKSLGAKFSQKTETGRDVVNEKTLAEIDLPEAALVSEYLLLQKRLGLVQSWLQFVNNERVHGRVITCGAVTGRMTHASPNMGQIPSVGSPYGAECRQCWTVPEGYKLVGCDLSGIELRCLAHYMNDEDWTKEILEGDIHVKNQHAAGLPTKKMAKAMIYATLYGAGAEKIGSVVGGGVREGTNILRNFFENTPKLKALMEKVKRMAAKGTLPGLDGRRVRVRSEHAALNTLLQSCGAIIAKQWIVETHKLLKERGLSQYVKQVAMVHDEIQMEVKEDYAEVVAKVLEEAAANAGKSLGFRLPVDAESKIGLNWFDTH